MDVRGKTAIVTGSAVGVGRATALDLARRGANVIINYSRSEDDAKEALRLVEETGARGLLVRADVSKDGEVQDMVNRAAEAFGGVHVLVNNAGMTHFVPFQDLDGMKSEMWDEIFAVNVKGAFFCARGAAKAMRASGGGAIVNVASVAAFLASPRNVNYCATKAYLVSMTEGLAAELRGTGVRAQALCPGFTHSEFHARMQSDKAAIPPFMWLAAPAVVRASLEALDAGGPVVTVPGAGYRLAIPLLRLVPRGLVSRLAGMVRR